MRAGGAIRGSRSFSYSASDACTCTSMPTRSTSVHGPIGQPAPAVIAVSRSSGDTRASSSTRKQSFSRGMSTRLTTNPGVSWQRIGRLPSFSPTANAASTAPSDESSARTISTSGISGAGLKKCIPTTRSGVVVAAAISVTESADVFVARIVSGRTISLELGEELELRAEVLDDRLDDRDRSRRSPRGPSSARATRAPTRAPPRSSAPCRPCAGGSARSGHALSRRARP